MDGYAITVIITSYNLEKYIGHCFDDLKDQTMQDFDVLMVDDCSKDKTLKIAEGYRSFFGNRLNIVSLKENLGLPGLVRNYALNSQALKGKYVLFLDGDDRIESNMLETMYSAAIDNKADIVVCAFDRVYEETNEAFSVEMTGFRKKCMSSPGNNPDVMFINTSPWNKLWRREVLTGLTFPPIRVGEEVSFNYRAYMNSNKIYFTDEVLIHYKVRNNSVISNTKKSAIKSFRDDLEKLYREVPSSRKKIVETLIFLHIGLSMALRAADNKEIDLKKYVEVTRNYFRKKHNLFKNNECLKLHILIRHGFKGIAIWFALMAYRTNTFFMILWLYRKLGLQIKF